MKASFEHYRFTRDTLHKLSSNPSLDGVWCDVFWKNLKTRIIRGDYKFDPKASKVFTDDIDYFDLFNVADIDIYWTILSRNCILGMKLIIAVGLQECFSKKISRAWGTNNQFFFEKNVTTSWATELLMKSWFLLMWTSLTVVMGFKRAVRLSGTVKFCVVSSPQTITIWSFNIWAKE